MLNIKQSTNPIEKKVKTHAGFLPYFFIFSIITIIIIFNDSEKCELVKKLMYNKLFLMSLLGIIIFSVHTLSQKEVNDEIKHRKKATKEAILGFIIAIMAYIDLKAAPFWIIWFVSYYLE